MNRARPSSSRSQAPAPAVAGSSQSAATAAEAGEPARPSRKRSAPSSSTPTIQLPAGMASLLNNSGAGTAPKTLVLSFKEASEMGLIRNGTTVPTAKTPEVGSAGGGVIQGEFSDFTCSICMEAMSEPTITHCGHTYCRRCILDTIDSSGRCPKCGNHLTKEKLCPNFVLSDIIARRQFSSEKALKAEIFESASSLADSGAPPGDIVKLLSTSNYDNLNLNDLDRLLLVLQRRREIMALDDEENKRVLMNEFLQQLLKIKNAHLEQLNREITLINRDLTVIRTNSVNFASETGSPASTSKDAKVESCSSSSGVGFNTQPLRNVELEQKSISARKKRMYNHFDELSQVYFDTRNSETFDNRSYDATVPNGQQMLEMEDMEVLDKFGKTLSHITQYHSLKPLATLSYSADMLSNSNIVSSIEFDKDNEFFAIAGVTKKIKLFEYINVIGSSVDIHCPSAELSCNAKISCVAWSNYYKNSLASSDYDGCVSLWDVSTSSRTRSLNEHEKRVWSVDWSNGDPRLLASGSDDSKVKLWSTNTEKSIANLEAKANVCCVKFCPESTYVIAFGSADHCVHYYDFRNPKEPLGVLYGHKKAVSYVKFASKDELVSASTDSNLKLWNLDESMSCIRSFTGHINEKNFVGLATDGNYVACGSENNSLYLYYKYLPKPLFSFKFENHRSMLERPKPDESPEFVSAVAWKKGSPVVVAANSQGAIKILELV